MNRYGLTPRWWSCPDSECAVAWTDARKVPCWACGLEPVPGGRPVITSQWATPLG